ncbi:hypothetical protein SNK03_007864 [Fusarium graminearum]
MWANGSWTNMARSTKTLCRQFAFTAPVYLSVIFDKESREDFDKNPYRHNIYYTEEASMLVPIYLAPVYRTSVSHLAENVLFMGLPKFKVEEQKCKHCKKKLPSSNRVVVAYEVRNSGLCMTVRPITPKPPKEKRKIED